MTTGTANDRNGGCHDERTGTADSELLIDSARRESIGPRLHAMTERDARQRRELAKVQGWNDSAPFLRSAPEGGHYSADVWSHRERLTPHGVATIPGYMPTSEQVEDLANGLIPPTVRVRRRNQFASEIRPLSDFRPEREERRNGRQTTSTAATAETASATVQPQLAHDFTS